MSKKKGNNEEYKKDYMDEADIEPIDWVDNGPSDRGDMPRIEHPIDFTSVDVSSERAYLAFQNARSGHPNYNSLEPSQDAGQPEGPTAEQLAKATPTVDARRVEDAFRSRKRDFPKV